MRVPYSGPWEYPLPVHVFSRALACAIPALLLVVGFAGGCPSGPTGPDLGRLPLITSDDPKAEAGLRDARQAETAGKVTEAERLYRAFIADYPRDPLRPIAELSLGKLLLARSAHEEARTVFVRMLKHPDRAIAEQGRFYEAIAAHHLGDNEHVANTLQPMIGRTIDPADTSLLLRTLAGAQIQLGDRAAAITAIDLLASEKQPEEDVANARRRLRELIDAEPDATIVMKLYEELPRDGHAWAIAVRRAVHDAHAARDVDRTRQLLSAMKEHNLPFDEQLEEIAMRAAQPSEANPRAIGVILSLSGRARHVGELALRGVMLAAGLPPTGPPKPNAPEVIFRDDGGDPEKALAAVDELVTVHRVIAIVGPMEGHCAQLASVRAQELGVPLIALSPSVGITSRGPMVFQMFPSPRSEAAALIAEAKASGGATRFAVLYPEAPYGEALKAAFSRAAADAGVEVAVTQAYPADATSFGPVVGELAKGQFDALYIADHAARLAMLAPALAAAGLWSAPAGSTHASRRLVQVLAPAVAFDRSLTRSAGRYLQGALFSVPYDASAPQQDETSFQARFAAKFGSKPDAFAAFAHDAYQLARAAADHSGDSRLDVARRLLSQRIERAAGAASGFSKARHPSRATRVLRLRGNSFDVLP